MSYLQIYLNSQANALIQYIFRAVTVTHGHDMLSIRMIKLCGNSICKPLSIIFKDCISEGKFPHEWKKPNVLPVHKKENKQSGKL